MRLSSLAPLFARAYIREFVKGDAAALRVWGCVADAICAPEDALVALAAIARVARAQRAPCGRFPGNPAFERVTRAPFPSRREFALGTHSSDVCLLISALQGVVTERLFFSPNGA